MKTITVYLQSLADINPNLTGYRVHLTDPDDGIDYERRGFGSGFSRPRAVSVPDSYELAVSGDGTKYYFDGSTPMQAQYTCENDSVIFMPEQMGKWEAYQNKCVLYCRQVDLV